MCWVRLLQNYFGVIILYMDIVVLVTWSELLSMAIALKLLKLRSTLFCLNHSIDNFDIIIQTLLPNLSSSELQGFVNLFFMSTSFRARKTVSLAHRWVEIYLHVTLMPCMQVNSQVNEKWELYILPLFV